MLKPKRKRRPWQTLKQELRPMQDRKRVDFYHTSRWKRESRIFRQEHPLCAMCETKGFIEPSEVVDHIVPLELCDDPWDHKNWQAVSRRCNNIKAAQDKKMINEHRKRSI